jgi:hypothetical protein
MSPTNKSRWPDPRDEPARFNPLPGVGRGFPSRGIVARSGAKPAYGGIKWLEFGIKAKK